MNKNIEITADMKLHHICENCGKEEWLTSEKGFDSGWDYPPRFGDFGVISPRTCGDCPITTTLWWQITVNKTPISQLSEKQIQVMQRILGEPANILQK